ncbi:hypothetical protein RZS08_19790, partial [Arthrospira platensis SPKY1]|nr:hypothetical protein [Arthrospira platensis SPKY1]
QIKSISNTGTFSPETAHINYKKEAPRSPGEGEPVSFKKESPKSFQDMLNQAKEKKVLYGSAELSDEPPDPMTAKPESVQQYVKDQTGAILKAIAQKTPKKVGWFERNFASPEFWQHPVLNKIVVAFTETRDEVKNRSEEHT